MTHTKPSSEQPTPRSADRMLRIMELLAQGGETMSLSTICREIETPKSSVLNLMRALVKNGYVDQVETGYKLSGRSFALAAAIQSRRRFPDVALPLLRGLTEVTGETALLAQIAPSGDEFVYIAKEESSHSLRFSTTVGHTRPLYCTASGLVLLSRMDPDAAEAYLARTRFVALTPHTRTSRREIKSAIAEARAQGYARTNGESSIGLSAIAAPIVGSGNHLSAVVIGGPSERMDLREAEFIARVIETAAEISEIMGGTRQG